MSGTDWRLLLPRPVRTLPADLAAVLVLVFLTDLAVLLPGVRDTPLRIVLGLPFVLFFPGYALIAALFPEQGESPADDEFTEAAADDRDRGIDGIERVALSFGLSIAIVPLIGLVLNFTPWGIRLLPIILSVSGFTVIAVGVAAVRRWTLPPEERFSVPYRAWLASGRAELFEPETRTDAALNVLLVASILLAVGSVGYAVAVPKQGEAFTEFYLLTRGDDGALVAADYPTEFIAGESRSIVVGIGNHEHQSMDYAVVVELQEVVFVGNTTQIQQKTELSRFRQRLQDNETWTTTYEITPTMTGDRLRLVFLLFVDTPPAEPAIENAYRETHLWINVTEPASG